MYIEINQIELCCALASNRTIKDFYAEGKTDSDINVDFGTHTEYPPEAQEVFDKYYDHFLCFRGVFCVSSAVNVYI